MWKVKLSRLVNAYVFSGNPKLMLSSRAYIEDRTYCVFVIDLAFWIIRKEYEHCRNSFYFDMKGEGHE